MKQTYESTIAYVAPHSLEELDGPSAGVIVLPLNLYWGPEQTVDLSVHADVQRMYQAVIRIGTVEDQRAWLNKATLSGIWRDLVLPERSVSLWESRFPQLRG